MKHDRTEPAEEQLERFERALAGWAGRPPRTPAPVAARQLLARLQGQTQPGDRSWTGWRPQRTARWSSHFALGLAMAAALALGALLARHAEKISLPDRGAVERAAAASRGDLVVLWLDAETPLYLLNLSPVEKGSPL